MHISVAHKNKLNLGIPAYARAENLQKYLQLQKILRLGYLSYLTMICHLSKKPHTRSNI